MPKKKVKEDGTRLLKYTGDNTVICDIPGAGVEAVEPQGTLRLSKAVADHYLSCGNWKEIKEQKEGEV